MDLATRPDRRDRTSMKLLIQVQDSNDNSPVFDFSENQRGISYEEAVLAVNNGLNSGSSTSSGTSTNSGTSRSVIDTSRQNNNSNFAGDSQYYFFVAENEKIGRQIGKVFAHDFDEDNIIRYELQVIINFGFFFRL